MPLYFYKSIKMIKRIFTSCICILLIGLNSIKGEEIDTLSSRIDENNIVSPQNTDLLLSASKNKFFKKASSFELSYIGIPLILSGSLMKSYDRNLQVNRTNFAEKHDSKIDDYLRFTPAALMLGLKVGGIKGRSSWGRMLTSDAFSTILMVGTVEILKRSMNVERPDGSDCRSFPSGHAASAFMMATMLHKEYGSISPWYSIGGYAVATYTAISRVINNNHWTSDVLTGAGIGIISTEIGYFLADLIFKDKGLYIKDNYTIDESENKFYVGTIFGLSLTNSSLNAPLDNKEIKLNNGPSVGIEGGYFFNKYIGLGMKGVYNAYPISIDDQYQNKLLQGINMIVGPQISFDLIPEMKLGGYVMGGYTQYLNCDLNQYKIGDKGTASFCSGLSLTVVPKSNFQLKLYGDYNLSGSYIKEVKGNLSYFSLGTGCTLKF